MSESYAPPGKRLDNATGLPPAAAAAPELHPSAGGRYLRNADGSLSPVDPFPANPQAFPALTQK